MRIATLQSWVVVAFSVVALLGRAAPADAQQALPILPQPTEARSGSFYLWGAGQARLVEIPEFRSHVAVGNSETPRLAKEPLVTTAGFAAGLGYHLPALGVGTRPRLELQFQRLDGSEGREFDYVLQAGDVRRSVDGMVSAPVAGAGVSDNRLEVSYEEIDVALHLRTDFRLTPTLTLTPALGVFGGSSEIEFRRDGIDAFALAPGGFLATFTHVDLSTDHAGLEIGAHLAWRPASGWVLHGGPRLAAMYQYTSLRADDCATFNATPGPCPGPGLNVFATSARSSDTVANVRISADVGVTYQWSWIAVTAQGLASWQSDAPGVRVPTGSDAGRASVSHDHRFSYGGVLAIIVPFP